MMVVKAIQTGKEVEMVLGLFLFQKWVEAVELAGEPEMVLEVQELCLCHEMIFADHRLFSQSVKNIQCNQYSLAIIPDIHLSARQAKLFLT